VEDFYSRPQDIEWAIDGYGDVYILQARPITTMGDPSSLSFIPPGEGFYTFDPTHFPRPLSPWMRESYSFDYCTPLSRKTGALIETINFRYVHGYAYTQPRGAPPSPALERAAEAYWSKKLYEDDYREFRDFFLPDTEILQDELRSVNPSSLSHNALVKHVARCFDLATEFWKRHHTYTFPTMVIIGDYMNRMSEMCGKTPNETLALLEGASPETRGLLNRQDLILAEMYDLLQKSDKAMDLMKADPGSAAWALDCLLHFPGRLGEVMREVRILYGWRLAGSYDLVTPALIETPHFFLQTIFQGTQESPVAAEKSYQRVRTMADGWKSALPEEKHAEFEEILDVGRRFFRMRDERGLFTDLSGVGLCRRGILEGGRRLCDQGVIFEAEHLCLATKREAIALLRGDLGMLGAKDEGGSKLDLPTPRELQRRYEYIHSTDPNLIPRALGTPPPPPDPMQLPPNIRRTMGAIFTGLVKGIWDEGQDDPVDLGNDSVKGVAASMGITEGPVRMVTRDGDLQKVRKGDIVVTYSCSASFNIVLGLCAGIVTDYGGMLSHAAICAREYGIPAIVGSQDATQKFKDGDYVRIDSSKATVTRIRSASVKEISF
jgi:rifampicin phosphotransferase